MNVHDRKGRQTRCIDGQGDTGAYGTRRFQPTMRLRDKEEETTITKSEERQDEDVIQNQGVSEQPTQSNSAIQRPRTIHGKRQKLTFPFFFHSTPRRRMGIQAILISKRGSCWK
jgi:hypothetical protein